MPLLGVRVVIAESRKIKKSILGFWVSRWSLKGKAWELGNRSVYLQNPEPRGIGGTNSRLFSKGLWRYKNPSQVAPGFNIKSVGCVAKRESAEQRGVSCWRVCIRCPVCWILDCGLVPQRSSHREKAWVLPLGCLRLPNSSSGREGRILGVSWRHRGTRMLSGQSKKRWGRR